MCMYVVCLSECLPCTCRCPQNLEVAIGSPETSYRQLWVAQCRCWESNPAPLEEQPLLLTAELSFQPTEHDCLHLCHACMHVLVCVFSKGMLRLVVPQSACSALLDHLRMVLSISSLFGTQNLSSHQQFNTETGSEMSCIQATT